MELNKKRKIFFLFIVKREVCLDLEKNLNLAVDQGEQIFSFWFCNVYQVEQNTK